MEASPSEQCLRVHCVECVHLHMCVMTHAGECVLPHLCLTVGSVALTSWPLWKDVRRNLRRRVCVFCNRPVGRETYCVLTAIAVIANSCPLPILYSEGLCLLCLPRDLPSKTTEEREQEPGEGGGDAAEERERDQWTEKNKMEKIANGGKKEAA